jgi:CelD/BcsL family acetyltransferase involved in cellulose biosynthesis
MANDLGHGRQGSKRLPNNNVIDRCLALKYRGTIEIMSSVMIAYGETATATIDRCGAPSHAPVFGSAPWVLAAWRHLPELGSPAVLRIDDAGRSWLLPLSLQWDAAGATISIAGAPLGDAHGLVGPSTPPPALLLTRALDALIEAGPVSVELAAMSPTDALSAALATAPDRWSIEREPSPGIDVSLTPTSPGQRRRWRRLSRHGRPSVHVIGPELAATTVEDFVRRRLARWRAQGRLDELGSVEHLPGFPAFLAEAGASLAAAGLARLWQLRIDGEPVAIDLHLGPATEPLLYMRDYTIELGQDSPGRVLLEATLDRLRRDGVARLETGRGDEPYKMAAGGDGGYVINAQAR